MVTLSSSHNDAAQADIQTDIQAAIHIVIPARYHSSRLPAKPLLNIHGKPMILWVAERASQATFADDLCIATDDTRIAKVCLDAGYDVVMTANTHVSGTDRLAEVACIKGWNPHDIVVNMQGDEPLVPAKLLNQVKELLEQQPQCVMATLYEPIVSQAEFLRASVVKVVSDNQGCALYFSRTPIPCDRQYELAAASAHPTAADDSNVKSKLAEPSPLPPPKHANRHLGLYAYRVQLLQDFVKWPVAALEALESLEQLRVLENGGKIAIAKALIALPAGVDTQADLDRLNAMPLSMLSL